MSNKLKILLILSVFSTFCFAADLEEGKETYESDCVKCHDNSVFTRPSKERKVNDLAALKKQVHRCATSTGASWFEEDEENVVAYLNETFYKFKKQP